MAEKELIAIQLSTLDELTQISNRRGFITLAQKSLNYSQRLGVYTALVYLDLNQFKQINDKWGHAIGDQALKDFALLLKNFSRDSDVFGRIGGDEFVLFLNNVEPNSVSKVVDRLRTAVNTYNKTKANPYQLTFSAGVRLIPSDNQKTLEDLLQLADRAMYHDKTKGPL